jgi:hypothetical protein
VEARLRRICAIRLSRQGRSCELAYFSLISLVSSGANDVSEGIPKFKFGTGQKLDTSILGSLHRGEAIYWDGRDARFAKAYISRIFIGARYIARSNAVAIFLFGLFSHLIS